MPYIECLGMIDEPTMYHVEPKQMASFGILKWQADLLASSFDRHLLTVLVLHLQAREREREISPSPPSTPTYPHIHVYAESIYKCI